MRRNSLGGALDKASWWSREEVEERMMDGEPRWGTMGGVISRKDAMGERSEEKEGRGDSERVRDDMQSAEQQYLI